jgi:hypothetical protein
MYTFWNGRYDRLLMLRWGVPRTDFRNIHTVGLGRLVIEITTGFCLPVPARSNPLTVLGRWLVITTRFCLSVPRTAYSNPVSFHGR